MNKSPSYERKNCRLCNSNNLTKVLILKATPIGDAYRKKTRSYMDFFELSLNRCNECSFVQLSHIISSDLLYRKCIYRTSVSFGLPHHFKILADSIIKQRIITKNSKILEIGCNDATFLNFLKSKGCKVLGVDPALGLVKSINSDIDIIRKNFDHKLSKYILLKYSQFDLVVANNVIANIDNLNDLFKGIELLIKDDGFFLMETFSLYGVINNNLIDNIYHEHLSYFTIKELSNFVSKFNLKLFDAKHLKVKGGSIRCIFKKTLKDIMVNQTTSKSIKEENKSILNSKYLFKQIIKKNTYNKTKLKEFLDLKKKTNKQIAGYGASVGTTTLLYYYGVQEYFEYFFDDNIKKHNLYAPGTNIKVLSSNQLLKLMPDYVVIFAWRYSEIIIKKNGKYIDKGGKFITPLPNFKII